MPRQNVVSLLIGVLFAVAHSADLTALPTTTGVVESSATPSWTPTSENAWNKLVADTDAMYAVEGIQEDCKPKKWESTGSSYRGTILLIHGFTACPSQFFDLAPLLAAEGFTVIAPLIPGHGLLFDWVPNEEWCGPWYAPWSRSCVVSYSGEDQIDNLITDVSDYMGFVDRMNDVMKVAEGERVVMGLSLGGAVAMLTGTTTYTKNDGAVGRLYDRQLLVAPLIGFSDPLLRTVLSLAYKFPFTRNTKIGWGEGCEEERRLGRSGICNFRMVHPHVGTILGKQTLALIEKEKETTDVASPMTQVVYAEADAAVDNGLIRKLYSALVGPKKAVCSYTSAVPHSMLSKFDTPLENKFYLKEVSSRFASFMTGSEVAIDDGTALSPAALDANGFLNTDGVLETEAGEAQCILTCDASTCPYSYTPPGSPDLPEVRRKLQNDVETREDFAMQQRLLSLRRRAESAETPIPEQLWTQQIVKWFGSRAQEKCMPLSVAPEGKMRGVALLFHGFSSCPAELELLANAVAARGFQVLVPLLPGHGSVPEYFHNRFLRDNHEGLPQSTPVGSGASIYTNFVKKEMRAVMEAHNEADATLELIVGGVSLGGALAHIAAADAPGLYDRVLLVSPFYGLAQGEQSKAFHAMATAAISPDDNGVHKIANLSRTVTVSAEFRAGAEAQNSHIKMPPQGWDEATDHMMQACGKEREQGRPGYCQFSVGAVTAALDVAQEAAETPASSLPNSVYFVGVENDEFVDTEPILKIAGDVGKSGGACFYGDGANHNLPSPYSRPWEDKWWMESFTRDAASFIADGEAFPTKTVSSKPVATCAIANSAVVDPTNMNNGAAEQPHPVDEGNISDGALAGIVIGAMACGALIAAGVLYTVIRRGGAKGSDKSVQLSKGISLA